MVTVVFLIDDLVLLLIPEFLPLQEFLENTHKSCSWSSLCWGRQTMDQFMFAESLRKMWWTV